MYTFPSDCLWCDVNVHTYTINKHSSGKYSNPQLLNVNNSEPEDFNMIDHELYIYQLSHASHAAHMHPIYVQLECKTAL